MQKKPPKKLPKEVISHWPEVFKDINIDVVPLEYLHSIRIEFADGKLWEIDVNTDKTPPESVATTSTLQTSFYAAALIAFTGMI